MSWKRLSVFSLFLIVIPCASARFIIEMETPSGNSRPTYSKYAEMRKEYMEKHLSSALGSNVTLNEQEQQLNEIIMKLKDEELNRGFQNPFNFTPAHHFFEVYKSVESSPLFKIIQKMPKGLCSRVHDVRMPLTFFSHSP